MPTPAAARTDEARQRFDIRRIEDLGNAIFEAEFEAIQMAGPSVGGNLAFAARDGVVWSSGRIEGNVLLRRTQPDSTVTIGILLVAGRGSLLGMRSASDGTVGITGPDVGQVVYLTSGAVFLAATMTQERLKHMAERAGLPAVPTVVGAHPMPLGTEDLEALRRDAIAVHDGATSAGGAPRAHRA